MLIADAAATPQAPGRPPVVLIVLRLMLNPDVTVRWATEADGALEPKLIHQVSVCRFVAVAVSRCITWTSA
jgi:hypothetical protein